MNQLCLNHENLYLHRKLVCLNLNPLTKLARPEPPGIKPLIRYVHCTYQQTQKCSQRPVLLFYIFGFMSIIHLSDNCAIEKLGWEINIRSVGTYGDVVTL